MRRQNINGFLWAGVALASNSRIDVRVSDIPEARKLRHTQIEQRHNLTPLPSSSPQPPCFVAHEPSLDLTKRLRKRITMLKMTLTYRNETFVPPEQALQVALWHNVDIAEIVAVCATFHRIANATSWISASFTTGPAACPTEAGISNLHSRMSLLSHRPWTVVSERVSMFRSPASSGCLACMMLKPHLDLATAVPKPRATGPSAKLPHILFEVSYPPPGSTLSCLRSFLFPFLLCWQVQAEFLTEAGQVTITCSTSVILPP
ncbi:hypothetical protein P280DRAFT_325797 [Massarina eburnea CBS 473.64]|uniref:Uncharacterized protein n=1 Tax=Massarina eburnea CBS 473.64 TaxID=1395130 RepID=A0A6A6S2W3_9PLEO|nr:hypothetical protein P280DRAFT_325797 [Massarina eburnea CBS 473.64]